MTDPNLWNQFFVWPILNLLVAFYRGFETIHIPGPLGFAIIALTLVIRLILYPLMKAQMTSARKMTKMKPHMDALNVKHKGDKQALQQAQLALYKEHGVNPAAGCLPLLVQMPVLIALYNVFSHVLLAGDLTKVVTNINAIVYAPFLKLTNLDLSFFGLSLAIKPSQWQTHGWWLLLVPVVTGLLQWYQSKLMMPAQTSVVRPASPAGRHQSSDGLKTEDRKLKTEPDTAMEMQKQMMIMTPIMFGFFAFQFPLGLALYWNIFGLFGIMQQRKVNKE